MTAATLAKKHGGVSGGEENGRAGYNVTMAIAYIADFMAEQGIQGETFETCCNWDRIDHVIEAAKTEAKLQHEKHGLIGAPFISSRITQQYHSGVCIYFTYGYFHGGEPQAAQLFEKIYLELKRAVVDAGGAVSHHHGIGKVRAAFNSQLYDGPSLAAIKAVKSTMDPQDVFCAGNNALCATSH